MTKPRILVYDLETSPLQGYVWRPWKTNLISLKQDWRLLTVSWTWLGERAVHVVGLDDFEDYIPGSLDDYNLAVLIRDLFDEADIAVTHNGNAFDQPKARTRMVSHELDPPSVFREVDTLKVARKEFAFTYNSLEKLASALGLGVKGKPGFGVWEGCMAGDSTAWKAMKRYCRNDVVLLRELYLRLLPWMTNHPNMAMISDKPKACPKCGSEQGPIQSRGWRYYQVTKRRAFRCHACGGIFYGRHLQKSDAEFVS